MGKGKFKVDPCPCCGGMDLDWERPQLDPDGLIYLDMECEGCNRTWSRIFESTMHDDIYPET